MDPKVTKRIRIAIAERLRMAREAAGLSQGQAAKIMHMHRPTVSEIEAGRRRLAAQELTGFAEAYGVSVAWLLGESDEAARGDDSRRYRVTLKCESGDAYSEE